VSIGTGMGAAKQQLNPKEPLPPDKKPGKRWKLAIVGLIGVYALLAGYDLIANSGHLGLSSAGSASPAPRTATPKAGAARTGPQPTRARSKPTPAPTAGPASHPATRPLDVVSVAPFGPDGTSDGDNPGLAYRILDVSTDQPWYSQWYASPSFGGLRSGTGLLLDLGATETVTDVELTLGSAPGADAQIRIGSTPALSLPTAASAWDVGGTVRMTTNSTQGRYVLVWFTRLPSAGQGHYQISVYNITVDGVSR
jgi:hypothetical protein